MYCCACFLILFWMAYQALAYEYYSNLSFTVLFYVNLGSICSNKCLYDEYMLQCRHSHFTLLCLYKLLLLLSLSPSFSSSLTRGLILSDIRVNLNNNISTTTIQYKKCKNGVNKLKHAYLTLTTTVSLQYFSSISSFYCKQTK